MIPQGRFSLSAEGLLLPDSRHWEKMILPHKVAPADAKNARLSLNVTDTSNIYALLETLKKL
jgi:hypothetical protein